MHNGSSIFTGDAGSGESNARRYLIENDLVEAIIALPENMFYNTGIGTFIWILSNKKEERRKGKIQLIDATAMKSSLRRNMGKKNCEFTPDIRKEIVRIFLDMEESDVSKVFSNDEFAYWSITVERPLRLRVFPDRYVEKKRREAGLSTSARQSLNMVFMGNPGTGKTYIARTVARLMKHMEILKSGQLIETDRSGLVGQYLGQTAQKTREVFMSAMGGVLFIDEAYSLSSENMFDKEAIDTKLERK